MLNESESPVRDTVPNCPDSLIKEDIAEFWNAQYQ